MNRHDFHMLERSMLHWGVQVRWVMLSLIPSIRPPVGLLQHLTRTLQKKLRFVIHTEYSICGLGMKKTCLSSPHMSNHAPTLKVGLMVAFRRIAFMHPFKELFKSLELVLNTESSPSHFD